MNVLIIGGTGFISSYLVRKLVQRGHKLTLFNRGRHQPVIPQPENVKTVTGDRNKHSDLIGMRQKQHYDVIYDMVAYLPQQSQLAVEIFRGKTGRFVHCSTISVYMISNDVQCPITEDQAKGKLMEYNPRNPFGMDYGIQKRECEQVLWKAHDPKRFPVSMLRPTYVSGPGDPTLRDWFWIERILDGKTLPVPGSGDFAFQQVYVEDVVEALARLTENDNTIGQAYNVAAEEIYSLNTYLEQLANLLDKRPEIVHIDQDLFDCHPLSQSDRGDVFPFNTRRTAIFSLDRIKKDLNYRSTPFEKWMPLTIDWYKSKQKAHSIGYEKREKEIELAKVWKEKYYVLLDKIHATF